MENDCLRNIGISLDYEDSKLLNRFWLGLNLNNQERKRIYRSYAHTFKQIYIALFTSKLSQHCQKRYYRMLLENVTDQSVLGDKGRAIRNFLEIIGPDVYLPIVLTFATFSLTNKHPVYINYNAGKELDIPYMIAAWNDLQLIQSKEHHAKQYFTWWRKKIKALQIYNLLDRKEIQEEYKVLLHMSGMLQLEFYFKTLIQKVLNSYYLNKDREYISVTQSLILGYFIRNVTNHKNKAFKANTMKLFIQEFVKYNNDNKVRKTLEAVLVMLNRSQFIRRVIQTMDSGD